MESLNLPESLGLANVMRCQEAAVYADGVRRRDIEVMQWEILPGPEFGRVKLAVRSAPGQTSAEGMSDFSALPAVGTEILVVGPSASGGGRFAGVVAAHILDIGTDSHGPGLEC